MRVCSTLLRPLLAALCALPSCAFTDEEGTLDVQAPPPSLAAPPAEGEPLDEDLLAEVEGVIFGDVGEDRTIALGDALGAADASLTVEQAISRSCTTTIVRGLSTQLVEEINCLRPDTLRPIPQRDDVALDPSVFPYLQSPALAALTRALDARSGVMYVNSGLRTIAQQYLLYRWYQSGRRCGIRLAAAPGRSNHESGLALDLDNYSTWRTTMTARGWRWFGSSDAVHFDFVGGGAVSLSGLSVRAFQRLWNHNNPRDRISEDGVWGNQTAARLARSPAAGFSKGATCAQIEEPQADQLAPVEVYWAREANGVYVLRALAPSAVVRVDYLVDDFKIASSTRDDGANFPASYTFNVERDERLFEVRGFDAQGRQIALGQGLMDVTPGTAVAIRQLGAGLYEIGLERPPVGAAALEVRADGVLLTDGLTQTTRSERLGVRSSFNQLGPRSFELTTYNADGTPRGTLRRTFTLR